MITRNNLEPEIVVAGDTLKWCRYFPKYRPTDGWALSYALINAQEKYAVASDNVAANGDEFAVTVPGTATATWVPGQYSWQGFVTKGSERHCIGTGTIAVRADLSTAAEATDQRTHNQKMYDAICAVLEGRSTSDVQRYTVGGNRSFDKMTVEELETWKRTYAWRVARENGRAPEYMGAVFKRPR